MKLYIGNLPFTTGEEDIRELLADYGQLEHIHLPIDRETQRPRGFAFVTFADKAEAQRALQELDQQDYQGRSLRLSEARETPRPNNNSSKPSSDNRERRGPSQKPKGKSESRGGYSEQPYDDWGRDDRKKGGGGGGGKKGKGGGGHNDRRRGKSGGDDWGW